MARPKQYTEDRIQAQIRFMPDTHARLKRLADARLVSLAYLVEQAVLAKLPEWEAETKVNSNGHGRKATPAKATKAVAAKTTTPAKKPSKSTRRPVKAASVTA